MTTEEARLLGAWDLVDYTRLVDDDVIGRPLGDRPLGQLVYTEQARVSAILMRRDRPWSGPTSFLEATDEQRGKAAVGCVAYAGRFRLADDVVSHDVMSSLYVEMVGTTLVRTVTWLGGDLLLRTVPAPTRSGRTWRDELRWSRA